MMLEQGGNSAHAASGPERGLLGLGAGAAGFNWLPVFLADRRGMFATQGLRIEIHRMGSVDKATAAVRSGELDIAITPPEGAIRDCVAGGDLRIIAGNVNRLPLSLIANPRFRRIEELRGKTLGTSSLTEGTALYTMEMLRQHGLDYPGDYQFSVVGVHPARWKALREGTIDAALQLIPLNFVAIDAGWPNLGEASDYIPEIIFTALVVQRSWANGARETLHTFLRILHEATGILHDPESDDILLAITRDIAQAEGDYARKALDYMRIKQVFTPDLSISEAAFAKTLELMQKAGVADATIATRAYSVLDDSYRHEALARA